jgi:hypothetical protein
MLTTERNVVPMRRDALLPKSLSKLLVTEKSNLCNLVLKMYMALVRDVSVQFC